MFLKGVKKPDTRIFQQIKIIAASVLQGKRLQEQKDCVKVQHIINFGLCFFPTSFEAELLRRYPRMGFYIPFVSLSKERCS